jgi:hypothetical protein
VIVQHQSGILALLLSLTLCLLGLFGALMSAKYYERHQMHMTEAGALRRRLDELFPELHIEEDWSSSRTQHQQRYAVLYNVRLHHLWTAVHLVIVLSGIILVFATLAK